MRDFVDIDAAVVGFLLVITIPALREGQCGGKGVREIPDRTAKEGRVLPGGDDYGIVSRLDGDNGSVSRITPGLVRRRDQDQSGQNRE